MFNPFKRLESSVVEGKRTLTVISNDWKAVAPANSFAVDKPQVLLLRQRFKNKTKTIPVYILKLKKGYRILDMECGGEYEWRVRTGMLMIGRRLMPGYGSKSANDVRISCCPD